MGSPDFAVPILETLASNYSVVGVITQPDRPAGRGHRLTPPPVKVTAAQLELPVIQPERLRQPDAMEQLRGWEPESDRGRRFRANTEARRAGITKIWLPEPARFAPAALARRRSRPCCHPQRR